MLMTWLDLIERCILNNLIFLSGHFENGLLHLLEQSILSLSQVYSVLIKKACVLVLYPNDFRNLAKHSLFVSFQENKLAILLFGIVDLSNLLPNIDRSSADSPKSEGEGGSFTKDAGDSNLASHLLYDLFADAQAETSSSLVLILSVLQLAKVEEELLQILFADSYPGVYDADLE